MEQPSDKPLTPGTPPASNVPPAPDLIISGGSNGRRTYQMGGKRKTALVILMVPMAAAFAFVIYLPYLPNVTIDGGKAFMLQVLVGGGGFCFLAFLFAAMQKRIETDATGIQIIGIFGTRRMTTDQMAGFRIEEDEGSRVLTLEAKPGAGGKLHVPLNLQSSDELLAWARAHTADLEKDEYAADLGEILENKEIGASPEEKGAFLKKERAWCKALLILSIPILAYAAFFPKPHYLYVLIAVTALPVVSLLTLIFSKGIVRIYVGRKTPYPMVTVPMLGGIGMLGFRALVDWNVLDWKSSFKWIAMIGGAFLVISVASAPELRKSSGKLVAHFLFSAIFGLGLTMFFNGFNAGGKITSYYPTVTEKHYDEGTQDNPGTTYYLTLPPWGPRTQEKAVAVKKDLYDACTEGSPVWVMARTGMLGIPYFIVRVQPVN